MYVLGKVNSVLIGQSNLIRYLHNHYGIFGAKSYLISSDNCKYGVYAEEKDTINNIIMTL